MSAIDVHQIDELRLAIDRAGNDKVTVDPRVLLELLDSYEDATDLQEGAEAECTELREGLDGIEVRLQDALTALDEAAKAQG